MAERERQPFADMNDVVRRAGLTVAQTEALATAGAFDTFGLSRRQALWNAGYADSPDTLPGTAVDAAPPTLPGMSDGGADPGRPVGDQDLTRGAPDLPPARRRWRSRASAPSRRWAKDDDSRRVRVGGLVTHRQRPGTAGGVTFLNLEDETGMLNIVCSEPMWKRYRRIGRQSNGLVIRGTGRVRRRGDQPGRGSVRPVGGGAAAVRCDGGSLHVARLPLNSARRPPVGGCFLRRSYGIRSRVRGLTVCRRGARDGRPARDTCARIPPEEPRTVDPASGTGGQIPPQKSETVDPRMPRAQRCY